MIRLLFVLSLLVIAACSPKQEEPVSNNTVTTIDSTAFAAQVGIVAYTRLSHANQAAQNLDSKLASFMHHPNPMSQAEIQQSWRKAYDSFLNSLIFAYLPIQDPPEWLHQRIGYQHLLTQLDSWPIEGGYIDYIEGYPFSGIVNDLTLTIDEASIRAQHRFTDNSNVSLGYQALEFMFWGGNGERSAHDFFPQENTAPLPMSDPEQALDNSYEELSHEEVLPIEPQNHNRRRHYTQLLSELLLKDLHRVQRRWEPSSGYYARLLQQSSAEHTLQAAFIAAQELISKELLNKRFKLTSSQFSQSNHADILAVLSGIEQWFIPQDPEQQEASLYFLIQQADQKIADNFFMALQQSKTCINKMTTEPADIDQCKQDTIGLLSHLRHAAKSLAVNLPSLD